MAAEPNLPDDISVAVNERSPWEIPVPLRSRIKRIVYNAIAEGVNTLFFILLLACARWLVEHIFGQSKFFDSVPVRYLFDAGDIAVIFRFICNTIKESE